MMEKYAWISKRFQQVKGVDLILMNRTPNPNTESEEVSLTMTNNRTGKDRKVFEFPLKTTFIVDYSLAPDCRHDYDIMDLEDPNSIVEIGIAKAKQFFN